jgi:DNA-binding response OmpR family regulator
MEVKLTPLEYNLLAYFLEHPGWVVTGEMVLNTVGGYDFGPNTRTVDAHVCGCGRSWNLINAAAPCLESAIV